MQLWGKQSWIWNGFQWAEQMRRRKIKGPVHPNAPKFLQLFERFWHVCLVDSRLRPRRNVNKCLLHDNYVYFRQKNSPSVTVLWEVSSSRATGTHSPLLKGSYWFILKCKFSMMWASIAFTSTVLGAEITETDVLKARKKPTKRAG